MALCFLLKSGRFFHKTVELSLKETQLVGFSVSPASLSLSNT